MARGEVRGIAGGDEGVVDREGPEDQRGEQCGERAQGGDEREAARGEAAIAVAIAPARGAIGLGVASGNFVFS